MLASAGGVGTQTLVVEGTGPDLSIMALEAGANITLTAAAGAVTIAAAASVTTMLASAGGGGSQTLVVEGTGPDLSIMGLIAGDNVTLTAADGSVTIASMEPAVTTLASTGGGGSQTLVVDGTGPDLSIMALEAGANITLTAADGSVTIAAAGGATTMLASAGGSQTLVVNGTGPDLTIMGLTAGDNITLTPGSGSVTIAANEAATTMLSSAGSGGSPDSGGGRDGPRSVDHGPDRWCEYHPYSRLWVGDHRRR